jgi:hypothetical protein
MEPEGTLPYSQAIATGLYPASRESNAHIAMFPCDKAKYYHYYKPGSPTSIVPSGFQFKFCVYLKSFLCVLHAPHLGTKIT